MFHKNTIFNKIIKILFFFIDVVWIKKNPNIWIIGVPESDRFDGNARAFYEYYRNNTNFFGDIKLFIVADSHIQDEVDPADFIQWGTFDHFFTLIKSKALIFHHNYNDIGVIALPLNRKCFRISHGIHYKKVERANSKPSKISDYLLSTKYTIPIHFVSSKLDAMSAVTYFHLYLEDIVVTGAPKNDMLVSDNIYPYYYNQVLLLKEILKGKKLITYAPTWRISGSTYLFDEDEINALNSFLEENNAILGIAGHQYLKERHIPEGENFIDINKLGIDIQSVLSITDILITDYSSVWIDYLILDKPIILFMYDYENYIGDRGFIFDTELFSPNNKCYNFRDLLFMLDSYELGNQNFLKDAFHNYNDGNNCCRVARYIMEITQHDH